MPVLRNANQAMFQIRVEGLPDDELRVLRLRGQEGISQLFRFDLELVSENPSIEFASVVGQAAALAIAGTEADRYVNGIVCRFEQGSVGKRFTKYYAQIVPRVWRLLQRVDSRIFQETSAPQIVAQVLEEAGIASSCYRSIVKATYPSREYCVQYQESDWEFISRILEEEGIFYFFEHSGNEHVLVLGDDPSAHAAIGGDSTVVFQTPTGFVPEVEYVGTFRHAQSVRTGAYALRAYDYMRPTTHVDALDRGKVDPDLESFEYPGRHHSSEDGRRLARVRLGEREALRYVSLGHSVCRRFVPGFCFSLAEHPRSDFNAAYLLTDLAHEGYEPQALEQDTPGSEVETEYTNEFRCIPSDVPYRPLRMTGRPAIHGLQPAVVVGPPGEEIYTDAYGRIKVQFLWDRRGQADEKSSCWVRVAQAWAGAGSGAMFLPRVGWEVLVSFLDGDIDQPVAVGSLYNANQMPPHPLPDHKNLSTIKSASSPGATGFNELRFDDTKGEEQVFLHAQKNLDVRIGQDRYALVGRDEHVVVKQDRLTLVQNEEHRKVGSHAVDEVAGDRHLTIGGKELCQVSGSRSLTVAGNVMHCFRANHFEQTSQGSYSKAMTIVIDAMSALTLKCGASSVVLDGSGVTLTGPLLTLDAPMVKIASGPGSPAMSGSDGPALPPLAPREPFEPDDADPATTAATKANQYGLQEGKYGALRPEPFQRSEQDGKDQWIEIELVDEAGSPVAGEAYEVSLPDGRRVARGTLDENGMARIEGIDPGTCRVRFPRLHKDAWDLG